MNIFYTFLGLLVWLNWDCDAQGKATVLRIDPETAIGCPSSKIFTEVDYIPLETTRTSLFGRIDQLYVMDEYYVILDKDTNSILFFLKNGKFHSKISCGPKTEELKAQFFRIDKVKKLLIVGYYFNKVRIYNFDGKLIGNREGQPEFEYFYLLPDSTWINYVLNYDYRKSKQDTLDYEVKFVKNGKIFKHEFPYVNYNKVIGNMDRISGPGGAFFESGDINSVTLIRYFGYDIYSVDTDAVRNTYSFIFPQKISLPQDFLHNPVYYGKRIDYIKNNPKVIFTVSYFFKVNQFLFFKLNALGGDGSYIYDLTSRVLIATDHIESNADNHFLPIAMNGSYRSANFISYSFLTTDGTNIYASSSSREMFNAMEAARGKEVTYARHLQDYFKNSSVKSNPVIIKLKPKSGYLL